jgi:hypothetical protein
MEKVLFISKNYKTKEINGGNEVTKRNLEVLKEFYEVDELLLDYKISFLKKLKCILIRGAVGFNKNEKEQVARLLKEKNYKMIWLDNSLYGAIAKYIRKINPTIKIITFFHNVEYLYFKDKYKTEGLMNLFMLYFAFYSERTIMKLSNKVIVLNERDNINLNNFYKKNADLIVPLTLRDKFNGRIDLFKEEKEKLIKNALFVGSNFFANIYGINWFIENVLPHLNIKVIIVGYGMEILKEKYKNNSKVEVRGFVKDISEEYRYADFVIAPIFHGSGMKTKTTEALMHGKKVYGTSEAFEGFEVDFKKVGGLCNTVEDFVENILNHSNGHKNYPREIYLKKYSNDVIRERIKLL